MVSCIRYALRPMVRDDIPQVSAIDREAFPTQWPPPPFKRDLENRLVRYLVAVDEDGKTPAPPDTDFSNTSLRTLVTRLSRVLSKEQPAIREAPAESRPILGYAAIWMMVDEAHLTSIAVKTSMQRRGIGELLLIGIIELAMQSKARVVTLETRVSNSSAQALYEKYGFTKVGVRRGYYSDNSEDAVIMTTGDIRQDDYRARFDELKKRYAARWSTCKPNLQQ